MPSANTCHFVTSHIKNIFSNGHFQPQIAILEFKIYFYAIFPDVSRLVKEKQMPMKRTFTLLFITILLVYGYQMYRVISDDGRVTSTDEGRLSDIAEQVTAIPLETDACGRLGEINRVRRDGTHIFLLNGKRLHHFTSTGQYMGEIGNGGNETRFEITDYDIDPQRKQLIVVSREGKVRYYTYEGKQLAETVVPQERNWRAFGRIAYYSDSLWATVEQIGPQATIEQWLYRFDRQFNVKERRRLHAAALGRPAIDYMPDPQISVANGHVYVQASSVQPAYLLDDTLHLIRSRQLEISPDYAAILPLQIGPRFLFAICPNQTNYTFCFDQKKKKAYHAIGGFKDDFYQTGPINNLQPIDIENRSYCFTRNDMSLQKSLLAEDFHSDTVLFFVKTKA